MHRRSFLTLALVLGCGSAQTEATTAAPVETSPDMVIVPALAGLAISSGLLVPAFDPNVTTYRASSLSSLFPIDVTASAPEGVAVQINGVDASTGRVTLRLKPREDIVVTAARGTNVATYTIQYVPPDLPAYTVSGTPGGDEVILLSPNEQWLLAVDRTGAPLYYRYESTLGVGDFEQQIVDGKTYYSFLQVTENTIPGVYRGVTKLMDASFHDVAEVQLLPNRSHGVIPTDLHDFRVLGDQHYLAMAYVEEAQDVSKWVVGASPKARILACVIQEIDHGKVVFEWDSTDVPSLYADSSEIVDYTDTTLADYVHLNSIEVDPVDGNFLISLRHADEVLKLDRTTGRVLWTLGGDSDEFGIPAEQKFSHQHHVRRQTDGSITVFDNGNYVHHTRALSFRLDETNKTVTELRTIDAPLDRNVSTHMGSIWMPSSNRYLIGWGGGFAAKPTAPSVTELVDGVPAWTLTFTDPNVYSYRAQPVTLSP